MLSLHLNCLRRVALRGRDGLEANMLKMAGAQVVQVMGPQKSQS